MTPSTLTPPSVNIRALYAPIERAAIARFLGREDPHPEDLADVDPTSPQDDELDAATGGLAPLRSMTGNNDLILENLVARICLETVSLRLPQWAVFTEDDALFARKRPRRRTRRNLLSRRLFEINWGDSGPGFSWPEAYYVTWLTGYGAAVITASADSPDAHGYSDIAIGWFEAGTSERDGVRRCITAWWSGLREQGQERWAYLFDTGEVTASQAALWANSVWGRGESGARS